MTLLYTEWEPEPCKVCLKWFKNITETWCRTPNPAKKKTTRSTQKSSREILSAYPLQTPNNQYFSSFHILAVFRRMLIAYLETVMINQIRLRCFYHSFEVILSIAADWPNYLVNRSANNAAKAAERLLMTDERVIIYIWLTQMRWRSGDTRNTRLVWFEITRNALNVLSFMGRISFSIKLQQDTFVKKKNMEKGGSCILHLYVHQQFNVNLFL